VKRMVIIVRGMVQRAGFRDFIQQKAYRHRVKGCVVNVGDGSVKIIAEAKEGILEAFLKDIAKAPEPVEIEKIERRLEKAEGNYHDFNIQWEPNEAIIEKLETGFRYMKEMNGNLVKMDKNLTKEIRIVGNKVEGVGENVEEVGRNVLTVSEKVDSVGSKVDSLRTVTKSGFEKLGTKMDSFRAESGTSFLRMDYKYGKIYKAMMDIAKELREDRKQARKETQALIKAILKAKK